VNETTTGNLKVHDNVTSPPLPHIPSSPKSLYWSSPPSYTWPHKHPVQTRPSTHSPQAHLQITPNLLEHPSIIPTHYHPTLIELLQGDGRVLCGDTVQDRYDARETWWGEEGLDGCVDDANWGWQMRAVWPCRARHSLRWLLVVRWTGSGGKEQTQWQHPICELSCPIPKKRPSNHQERRHISDGSVRHGRGCSRPCRPFNVHSISLLHVPHSERLVPEATYNYYCERAIVQNADGGCVNLGIYTYQLGKE